MKKRLLTQIISLILASAWIFSANAQKFEAEDADYSGGVETLTGFSGTGCINLQENTDYVKIKATVDTKSKYNVYLGYGAKYGTKQLYVAVNSISSTVTLPDNEESECGEMLVGEFNFKAGENIIDVTPSWTWFLVDYIRIEKIEGSDGDETMPVSDVKGLKSSGTTLLDSCGNTFLMRGVNWAYTWFTSTAYDQLKAIAATNANAVRVVLSNGKAYGKAADSAEDVKKIIEACKSYGMVAILEVHDVTGSDQISDLEAAAKYFADMASTLKGEENNVIINIANEWHNQSSTSNWRDGYLSAIDIIRKAGLRHCIMCDAGGYGQGAACIHTYGTELLKADTEHNLIFSIHMYGTAGNTNKVKSNIDGVINQDLALCIGEFGWYHSDGDVDEDLILSYCKEKNVGWLAWSWYGNSSDVGYLDIVTNASANPEPASYNNITIKSWNGGTSTGSCEWGTKIINAIKEESVKIKNSCETSDTESAPSNEQVIVYPSLIEDEFTIVEDDSYKISIYDTTGKLIHNKLAYGTTKIDCKNWGKGIYHIIVAKNGDVKQSSILK